MANKNNDELIDVSFSINQFLLRCISKQLSDLNFAFTDAQGNVIEKGLFQKEIQIDLKKIPSGTYAMIIFNEDYNKKFSFYHQP
jgi:hypothetical protein